MFVSKVWNALNTHKVADEKYEKRCDIDVLFAHFLPNGIALRSSKIAFRPLLLAIRALPLNEWPGTLWQ